MNSCEAVVFDKDGTLVDFHQTWDAAVGDALRETAVDDATLKEAAAVLKFDLDANTILATSALIAESNDVIFELVAPILDAERLFSIATERSCTTVTPATGLPDTLHQLRGNGVKLAIATNDYESVVDAQLATLGWANLFETRVGSDSGFGAKPEPGMILGVLAQLGVEPADAVMVGDTGHDIEAGTKAGVRTVLVTNGQKPPTAVSEQADLVISDLSKLPRLLLTN